MKKRYLFLIVVLIISMWAASWYYIPQWYNKESLQAGTFGDMFGAVNALFSGLAFAGLIYTIAVQRQELQAQSKSIDMQTDEMKIQVSAIKLQTEELSLQREAIQMQTEEIKMQREETARSANQLEGQKNLLNLQTAMSVVNDLIQVKNKRLDEMKSVLPNERTRGSGPIAKLIENNGYGTLFTISENKPYIQSYLNTFFFSLSFIQNYDLQNEQKDILSNLVNMNTSDDELLIIYIAVAQNQHRLMMLKVNGFYPRHQKLTENSTKSSY